jgi:signal peptidase
MSCEPHDVNSESSDTRFWAIVSDLLGSGKCVSLRPLGGSMKPFIWPGDTVIIDPCDWRRLRFGDIVLFATAVQADSTAMRIHRIMKIDRENGQRRIHTRGDASPDADTPISPEDILGKVSAVTKGRWILDLDKPCGKAINLAWAHFQRWPVSMGMLRTGGKLMKSLIGLCGFSGLFSLFWGEARP